MNAPTLNRCSRPANVALYGTGRWLMPAAILLTGTLWAAIATCSPLVDAAGHDIQSSYKRCRI
jgi:hypothetical protein